MLIKNVQEALFWITIFIIFIILTYGVIPTLIYKLYHKTKKTFKKDKLYLTFDDGPHPVYTVRILDLLDKYNVKASFFVVGEFAKENPEIIKRMKDDGHLICMHSLKHKNGLFQTPFDTTRDFESSIKILDELGVKPNYFRPPWGHFNLATASELRKNNLSPVLWDVMAKDWSGSTSSQEIMIKLSQRTSAGDIICLHDGRGKNEAPIKTIEALEAMIPLWLSRGYSFETVDKYDRK